MDRAQVSRIERYPQHYPLLAAIDPSTSRCAVPDARYDFLVSLWKPASEYPAFLSVTDIAGLVKGAAEGAGLGNAFLSHIQAVDALIHVVRAFESAEIVHVDDSIDPIRDLETIQGELCLKDLQYVAAAEAKALKDCGKSQGMKMPIKFYESIRKARELLTANKPVREGEFTGPEVETIREILPQLITTKPITYVVNLSASDFTRNKNKHLAGIAEWVATHGGGAVIPMSVEYEEKLWALHQDAAATAAFLAETGNKSALPRIITTSFKELELMYFFTAGEKEVRCWTIMKNTEAPEAAGAIHSDFTKLFIAAEVVAYADFAATKPTTKSFADCKAAGKYRTEGSKYIVQDGDIVTFKIGRK
jgi:obg-like ATPase 1